MKGDYYRYLAEVADAESRDGTVDRAMEAYEVCALSSPRCLCVASGSVACPHQPGTHGVSAALT